MEDEIIVKEPVGDADSSDSATSPVGMYNQDALKTHGDSLRDDATSAFMDSLSPEVKGNEYLSDINDANSLAKEYIGLKESVSSMDPKVQDISEYVWKKPEGIETNEDAENKFKEFALENGLNKSQYSALNDFAYKISSDFKEGGTPEELQKAYDAEVSEQREILEKEWGTQYESKMEKVRYAITKEFGEDGVSEFQKMGIANNAQILKMVSKYSDFITEDSFHESGLSTNLQGLDSKIDALLGAENGAYFDAQHPMHESTVDQMHDLFKRKYG